jgi:hypothetical protein
MKEKTGGGLLKEIEDSIIVSNRIDSRKDGPYLKELQNIDFQPVFILGIHRSGTSILYKMLTATGGFNPVTAYHLINYDELLYNHHEKKEQIAKQRLTDSFLRNGLTDRGIDRLMITADFAEEYGFLLDAQTGQMRITQKNLVLFTELCKKIKFIAGNQKPILLKNPYDFPNFLYLRKVFPNARFVFIHRHPLKTISSTLHAIRTLLGEKNPYTAKLSRTYDQWYANPLLLQPLRFIFHFLAECCVVVLTWNMKKSTRYYLRNIEKLSENEYISITYESLCDHPQETLQNLVEKLQLKTMQTTDAAALMNPRTVKLDTAVQKLQSYINKSLREYCDLLGYTTDV